ncbi:chitobiase/beta-hexosaminidase C-terminal domain-containing protein [Maribacter sp. 2307ULW6-5]|uniref:chitobiase/beta-hexosaminidase C-terminal domain-containing protein n=1 Tax=Maribacter sp. 2307ULW6-5 TaxID=3386275 RepID=UPI0039BC3334
MKMIVAGLQLGNFHPLFVHLPIGIILMAFALEIYDRRRKHRGGDELIRFALGLGALSALASLGTGWLLGEEGGFDEELLFLHRWMAVAFTAATIVLFLLKGHPAGWAQRAYMPTFVLVLILISVTGHYGGSMTHGTDYLFREPKVAQVAIADISTAQVHAAIIQPIFEAKCVSCHNEGKAKGGLLMNTAQNLFKGGDSGPIMDTVNGKPLLLHRVHLPLEDEEHMPPKGKVQPTSEEIMLLEWWVANGHCLDCTVADLETTDRLAAVLEDLEEDHSTHALLAKEVPAAPPEWIAEMNALGIGLYPLAEGNPLLVANLFGKKEALSQDLEALEEYAENIVELNLGNAALNDDLARDLADFENLTKLQLQNTAITDASLSVLGGLEHLESLNLYGTQVTAAVFQTAREMPSLAALYLYGTKVLPNELKAFQEEHPGLAVQHVPEDAFEQTVLAPPVIIAETTFFRDSLRVALETTFEGASIHYTLDGSVPDSTSNRYSGPLVIKESTVVSAITAKPGWEPSKMSREQYKSATVSYAKVALNREPNEKYAAQGGQTLVDLKRGSTNFVDGAWLGYEGSHFSTVMELEESKEIRSVSVGALSAPASWIFFPTGIRVYGSEDGKNFKRIKQTIFPKEAPNTNVVRTFFDVAIAPTTAKFVKVEVLSPLKNPDWHPNPGGKSWIFVDEILLN